MEIISQYINRKPIIKGIIFAQLIYVKTNVNNAPKIPNPYRKNITTVGKSIKLIITILHSKTNS